MIPPEFRSWGAVPATHFIDPMMRFLGHDYYVGYLSAAEAHGAAVVLVEGERTNLKLTAPEDRIVAAALVEWLERPAGAPDPA